MVFIIQSEYLGTALLMGTARSIHKVIVGHRLIVAGHVSCSLNFLEALIGTIKRSNLGVINYLLRASHPKAVIAQEV